jgi:signal transduction histidine kinase/CheY-like chemotaxis protein
MNLGDMSAASQPQKRIRVRVLKHLPLGLLVETENDQHGIVRVREISWDDGKRQNWRSLRPPGWSGWAVLTGEKQNQNPEYSLRLAENDPWDEIPEKIDKSQVFEGIVTGVVSFGAFVELASGLTGLLHKSQLPAWVKTPPIDLFWPGDRVCVTIREVEREARRLSLGLPPLSQPPNEGRLLEKAARSLLEGDEYVTLLDEFLHSGRPKQHILLVEDEPEQQTAVKNWLTHVGQRVDAVDSAENALSLLEISRPDIALIDVGLPGMSGTDLAERILEKWPGVRVVIATDWARQESLAEILDDLRGRGVELYPKPLLPEDLIAMLKQKASAAESLPAVSRESPRPGISLADIPGIRPKSSIHGLLSQCRRYLGFEQAILFEFDPVHRATSILDRSGDALLEKSALPSLVYSPVRDVAEDGEAIVMPEISPHDRDRFRYLLELNPTLESCLGVPVHTDMQSNFALFLIGEHPRPVSKEQRTYAEAMAQSVGVLLEQKNFNEKSIIIQRTALIGHLTRAMSHEINNLVGPLAARLDNLQANLAKLEKNPNQAETQQRRDTLLNSTLNDTRQIVQRIINTTRMFGRIASKGKHEILRVDEIISETIHLLRDTSDRAHVQVVFNPPEQMLIIRSQAAAFEQVLLNIMLNAVQQIAEARPGAGGWVQVRVDEQVEPVRDGFFRILVEDNGPGIHARLWDKVFEAGYTTRHDGSGIGLYISRNLVEEMGGRIYVRQSCILGGATFALEIPYQL